MASNLHKLIRQSFDEICQKRQVSIYTTGLHGNRAVTHHELSGIVDALIDAVGCEMRIAIDEARSNHNG